MTTKLGDGIAYFDNWADAAGVKRKTIVGFGYAKWTSPDDGYVAIANGTTYQSPVSLTYTPKFANSILVIRQVEQIRYVEGQGCLMQLFRDGVQVPAYYHMSGNTAFFYKGDSVNHHWNLRGSITVPANNTNATTFTSKVGSVWGAGEFSRGWGDHSMFLLEVAQ